MKNIKEHIKQNQFKPVYLLYGSEAYLKKLYKDKLKTAILAGEDDMNFSYFEGKGIDLSKVIDVANTLPFFSDRRLVIIENSGLFKSQSDLADFIKIVPSTTHFIFVESEVDKRNRLYKAIKDIGTISEMNRMDEANLKLWIASLLDKDKKKITGDAVVYLLSKTGTDMENIQNEVEKLCCYALERDIITTDDIEAVCTTQIAGKIFQMVDAIGSRKQKQALELYYDLLALKEKPMSILFLITRQFNILIQVKDLAGLGYNNTVISQKTSLMPFTISKYISQGKNFPMDTLKEALQSCIDIEEQIKTGRLIDKIGVELLIIKYSATG
ncbi:DNA polymerase III subunit delta [Anaerocolumna cellulosilytica]|uniref:DNA polymerase III subunit delta n=1 Tax=Anaerocolumna cellulosilytica TaxID=433286 RepID=A0A6S6R3L7_9FIRM|nr:DNA polymerase III subunit delta [Anaerocolumna cellulosilytica]MBB5194151.1 DNA polymerase-3 subunit delta [Anaerocolumna cellulosilytica]BCJ94637.1 DNA polymerase III subunit delta [Anaerocolumna cellulosilytica]